MTKLNRRKFIRGAGIVMVSGKSLFTNSNQSKEMKNVFVHHVYFWLNNPDSEEDRLALLAGLKKLSAVTTIQSFHIGKPATTNREVIDTSYAASWLALFANKADQDSYQTDPIHLKFVEECSHLWKKVIVYDSVNV